MPALEPEAPQDFATLIGLVEHYSPSGEEGQAVGWLVKRMQFLGYSRAFADPAGNAVGFMGDGPRQAVLLGHIDTVKGEIPVRQEEDLLHGRGTVDAKGPLGAFVDAVARVGAPRGWQLVVIGAIDEERDSIGARYVADHYRPEFTIVGEPSRWDRVTLGYKGSAWAEITTRRPLAHTARQGQSACEAAFEIWEKVRKWALDYNAGKEQIFDQVLPTLRGFSSGENGFEEWARLRLGTRLPPTHPPESWHAILSQLAAGATVELKGYPIPAYRGSKNNPLVRAFLAGIRAAGGKPGFVLKTGTADMNIVAPLWGCPAVAYGPGDSTLDHTPNEHISLSEYTRAVNVLAETLRTLTQPTFNTEDG